MNCEIIAVGSELLTPYRQDTNSLFLTDRLIKLGVNVSFKTIVGDKLSHLGSAIRIALGRADIVITMGGLGPTEDDLTRQAVAEALGIRLRRNPEIVGALYARFAARRIQMTDNNARQADVLDGSVILENPRGTAPRAVARHRLRRASQAGYFVAWAAERSQGHVRRAMHGTAAGGGAQTEHRCAYAETGHDR